VTLHADAPPPYGAFLDHVRRLSYVDDAASVLDWDQQVMMPDAGTPARAKQKAALSTLEHDLLTDEDLAESLDALGDADLTADRAAVVREVRRKHDRARRVPEALIERISEATSNALPVWEDARAEADFGAFEGTLAELVDLKREYAAAVDPDRDPYEVLFEDYEPYLGLDTAERILARLGETLPDLVAAIKETEATLAAPFEGTYDEATSGRSSRACWTNLDTTATGGDSTSRRTRSPRARSSTPASRRGSRRQTRSMDWARRSTSSATRPTCLGCPANGTAPPWGRAAI
jgi:carboxypeptidase Taq